MAANPATVALAPPRVAVWLLSTMLWHCYTSLSVVRAMAEPLWLLRAGDKVTLLVRRGDNSQVTSPCWFFSHHAYAVSPSAGCCARTSYRLHTRINVSGAGRLVQRVEEVQAQLEAQAGGTT
jgi:hypothetical protein